VIRPASCFERLECKYLVGEDEARRIRRSITPFVRPDSHAADRPQHSYPISSLYLDADGFTLYRETIEGKKSRFKLRVRTYSDAPELPVFAEIKRREKGIVRKMRCPIGRELLSAILAGTAAEPDDLDERQRTAFREFCRLVLAQSARPRVLVRYDREAWVAADGSDTRVTFDRGLRTLRAEAPIVLVDAPGFRAVEARGVVLELKFNDRCPSWLQNVVRRHSLRRISFSKYCRSLDRAWTIGERPSVAPPPAAAALLLPRTAMQA
jgi:SPX domain protein involved in polyphosphate accumulation